MLAPLHKVAPDVGSAVESWVATALVQDALRLAPERSAFVAELLADSAADHLRSLYPKLGVTQRRDAVQRGLGARTPVTRVRAFASDQAR